MVFERYRWSRHCSIPTGCPLLFYSQISECLQEKYTVYLAFPSPNNIFHRIRTRSLSSLWTVRTEGHNSTQMLTIDLESQIFYSQIQWWGLLSWGRTKSYTVARDPRRDPSRCWWCSWWSQRLACSWVQPGVLKHTTRIWHYLRTCVWRWSSRTFIVKTELTCSSFPIESRTLSVGIHGQHVHWVRCIRDELIQ